MRWFVACLLVAASAASASLPNDVKMRTTMPPDAVIPKPVRATPSRGTFTLQADAKIVVKPATSELRRVGTYLSELLQRATGYALPVTAAKGAPTSGSIALTTSAKRRGLGDEGYELRVTPTHVTITAARAAGVFRGIQTLRQLLPASIEAGNVQQEAWRIAARTIRDRPRFPWRGVMLDTARHFFSVRDVKRLVDLMALYKLNRLHLHLSDDQGWRIAIRSWPRLASYGGGTEVGEGRGGHYTQKDYAEIVAYAQSRYIVVVPEIDMPGHTNAALASYARLNCDGVAPVRYTGIEVGFSSLCIGKEVTYTFVDDVIRELAALTPGPYLHIGGDEAAATEPGEYVRFVERVQHIVRAHGKRMIGWEETARAGLQRTSVVQYWHDPLLAERAVARGVKVVMSPATKAYLDMKYGRSTPLGLTWAGYTDVRDAYSWDPATQAPGVTEQDVLGVEAPLWSETLRTMADVEYMAFPRLPGHAEIGWSPASGRTWSEYRRRLAAHGPRLDALGVNFYRSAAIPWR